MSRLLTPCRGQCRGGGGCDLDGELEKGAAIWLQVVVVGVCPESLPQENRTLMTVGCFVWARLFRPWQNAADHDEFEPNGGRESSSGNMDSGIRLFLAMVVHLGRWLKKSACAAYHHRVFHTLQEYNTSIGKYCYD
jgi:hypothetical protein